MRRWPGRFGYEFDPTVVNFEKLVDFPTGKHALQNATVIGVRETDQVTGKPPIELRFARPTAPELRVNLGGNPFVLTTESAMGLQVTVLEQHLEHDGLTGSRHPVRPLDRQMRLDRKAR
jgi:hypothetical protein